jgi:Phospholipase_D-nuclease N-terminal
VAVSPLLAFGLLEWSLSFAGVLALVLGVSACASVFRNPELSGSAQAMWVVAIVFFPIFGSIVYFGVRSDW